MKLKSFGSLVAAAIAIGASTIIPQPTQAQTRGGTFFCGMSQGKPATLVRTATRGTTTMIIWINEDFTASGWTPERRCQAISTRFERFYTNGQLRLMKTGTVSGQPVICAASNRNTACSRDTVLITLPRGTNANAMLDRLLNTRISASSTPIYLSQEDNKAIKLSYDNDGNAFVDVDAVVQEPNWPLSPR